MGVNDKGAEFDQFVYIFYVSTLDSKLLPQSFNTKTNLLEKGVI